jgi:hypothetical protein
LPERRKDRICSAKEIVHKIDSPFGRDCRQVTNMETKIGTIDNIECRPVTDIRGLILKNSAVTGDCFIVMIYRFGAVIYYGEFDEFDSALKNYRTMMDLAMNELKMAIN